MKSISTPCFSAALLIIYLLSSCMDSIKPEGFQIEKGFELTLVASEPLIKDPVDLEFNENGDPMVLEMPGYPFEDQQSRIVLLKDRNDDGIYDDKVVYAENLQLASSILAYKSGVLVTAPPYLLHVKDLNGDLKVDVVDTLMSGFSTGNLQHNYNGLTYGLDNWIYAVNGGNSGSPFWLGDSTTVMDLRGQDFRFNLETRMMERLGESSGGFGLGMDEFGRIYETHNLTHISHLVFPDRYIKGTQLLKEHSLANISDHEENGLARIYPIGEQESRVNHPEQSGYFSGSCGITYYGGGVLGDDYNNTIWVNDVVLNLIHVDKVNSNGASMIASRVMDKREFLASSDHSFRPVNMSVGPDGAMYIVDMYRQVIEHPEWIPDEIEKKLDLSAGKDKGRIYKITKIGVTSTSVIEPLKTVDGMIKSLAHPNQWMRKTAHRLLMDQQLNEEKERQLFKLSQADDQLAKLHALWILHSKKLLKPEQLISALDDNSTGVQENVLRMTETLINSDEAIFRKVLLLTNDPIQRVRLQAALTLSILSIENFMKYKSDILNGLVMASATETDDWNIMAITLAAQEGAPELFSRLISGNEKNQNETLLASLALPSGKSVRGAQTILKMLPASKLNAEAKCSIVKQLTISLDDQSGQALVALIKPLEQSGNLNLVSELAAMRKKLKLPPSNEFLKFSRAALSKALDHSIADSTRIQQLALIELLPYEEKSEILFQCLQNREPLKLQEMALWQLSTYQEVEIGKRIVQLWKELGPQTRRYASDLLLYIELHHDALLTGLETGIINIGEMNFDLERRRTLLWWTDNENTKRRAEALFTDEGVTNRKDVIEQMKVALELKGSAIRGAKVFETICSNCHIYGSIGKDVGPVLTEISRKSKEALVHDILDPNAAADTKYINHRLETNSGDVHMGIVDIETDQYITIKKMGGEKVTIKKVEIKKFSSLGTSLMMEGLESSITSQEMADLLAFLQNSK